MAAPPIDVSQFEKLRPLGKLEQFSSARHHLGFYNNVGLTASYSHTSPTTLPLKQLIFAALASVIHQHPILTAIPVNEDSPSPYFARLPSINLEEAVTFITRLTPPSDRDVELDAILEKEHNTNFKGNYGSLPFWRLIISTEKEVKNAFTASFIFHHSIADGASGLIFHKTLHAALSTTFPLDTPIITSPSSPLLPNLELLHPLPPPSPIPILPHPNLWTASPITLPTTSRFRSLALSPQTTKSLLTACRANSVTLTSTLPVLIAAALSSHAVDLECTIPVSLRRFLPASSIAEKGMGVYIDAFSTYFPRQSFDWSQARDFKTAINSYLTAGKVNVGKFKAVNDMRMMFSGKVGRERVSSIEASNLGVFGVEKGEGGWEVGRVVFSRSVFASGSAVAVGVVSGGDGGVVLGFVWQEGVVGEDVMDGVVEGVRRGVEEIVLKGRD